MKLSKFNFHPVTAVLAGALSAGFSVSDVQAIELVWDGSGDSDSWFYSNNNLFDPNSNWTNNDVVPTAGDSLVFAGNSRLTPFNDELPGFAVGGISFAPEAGAFVLGGNAITTVGNIANLTGITQTVNMPISVGANQIWDGGTAGMVFNGPVTLGNNSLSLSNKVAVDNRNINTIVSGGGTAELSLSSGSTLTNGVGVIGDTVGSRGSVTITDANSVWTNYGYLLIGNGGDGALTIANGAKVSNTNGYLAEPNGTARVVVSGTNSLWVNSQNLFIGDYGQGRLTISGGAKTTSVNAYIGNSIFSNNAGTTFLGNGVVTVSDTGSQWINSGLIYLGFAGYGELNILAGGFVHSGAAVLGWGVQAEGNATVSDAFSNWLIDTGLKIGDAGKGTLNILAGGVVHSASGVLGVQAGSSGGANIKGAFSNWMVDGDLNIADAGNGNLNIETGGLMQDSVGIIGNQAGSTGTVTVADAGSRWINASYLSVGTSGTGALTINNGGQVFNSFGYLGALAGGNGTATVTGANSLWANSDALTVGQIGNGTLNIKNDGMVSNTQGIIGDFGTGSLNINTGGQMHDREGIIGNQAGSTGSVKVSDAFSKWINSSNLSVGVAGTGTLAIDGGGFVTNGDGYLGALPGSNGTATVAFTTSLWANNGTLTVGQRGTGTLNVENGGKVSNTVGIVGDLLGSVGNVSVTGTDSLWTNIGGLTIGEYGTGTLRIVNGGTVTNSVGSLGRFASGNGSASVSGNNSRWINSANLVVGEKGLGQLTIDGGGQVSNQVGVLGGFGKGTAIVTGTGSQWNNSSYLAIGDNGDGALSIENGAKVTSSIGYLGQSANGIGSVKVTGGSTCWINSNDLYIGLGPATTATLNLENGGQVRNVDGYLGVSGAAGTLGASIGNATVSGFNSMWLNDGNLTIGQQGTGSLLVQNQGLVIVRGDAFVDQGFGSGTLTVQSGGDFELLGSLNIGDQGKVILNGGELAYGTRNISSGGEFNWLSGTVALNNDYLLGADDWLAGLTLDQGKGLKFKQALTIGDYTGLTLNGGQLTANTLTVASTGYLDWQRGRLTLSSLHLGDPASGFGDYLQLNTNKALAVAGLSIGSAATLDVGNGATPNVTHDLNVDGVLAVGSGRMAAGGQISVATGGTINMSNAATSRLAAVDGIVNGGIVEGSGRLEGNVQNLNGGKLLLQNSQLTVTGTVNNAAGARIEGQGVLNTAGINNLGLMSFSGGRSDLRGAVTLSGPDSRIVNSGGSVLSFYDTVIHNGQEIRTGTGAQTVFFANVSGAGGFAGDGLVSFEGGYNPGNSPAAINFHGGDISFNAASVLTMEIFGNTPGSEYDQLLNIDHLDFNGTLALVFGNNFMPTAGSSFNLFGFNSFSGGFAPNRITVAGLDRALLDFSTLASNGKLQVAAVPLPTATWLFLTGLMGWLACSRRRAEYSRAA